MPDTTTIAEFVRYGVQVLEAIAWPLVIVIVVYALRPHLANVLDRLSSLRYKGVVASFGTELGRAEAEATDLRIDESQGKPAEPTQTVYDQLCRIAEISPRAAVSEAWRYVGAAAAEAANAAGTDLPRGGTVTSLVLELVRQRIFSEEAVPVFERLRRLRNEAVHAPEFVLDPGEVERYIDLALRMEQELYHAGTALGVVRGTVEVTSGNG